MSLNENVWIVIKISIKFFVPKGPINNIPAFVQIVAGCQPGDQPLSEPMMLNLLTYICVTRPKCVKIIMLHSKRAFLDCSQTSKQCRKIKKKFQGLEHYFSNSRISKIPGLLGSLKPTHEGVNCKTSIEITDSNHPLEAIQLSPISALGQHGSNFWICIGQARTTAHHISRLTSILKQIWVSLVWKTSFPCCPVMLIFSY